MEMNAAADLELLVPEEVPWTYVTIYSITCNKMIDLE